MAYTNTGATPIIVSTAEQLADLLGPYFDILAEKALERAVSRKHDDARFLGYEEARAMTGLGKSRFSQAVNDGTIPHYPNGARGKLFKVSDLNNFKGYKPQSAAEKQFEQELKNRK